MNLKKILTSDSVKVGLRGTTKKEIIEELVDIIVANGQGLDKEIILKAILDREAQMSTGMSNGIAIPHGKTDSILALRATIAVSENPVDFESLDGLPSRIFVMTVSPASETGPHLQFLAEVSRLLSSEDVRRCIIAAKTSSQLLKILHEGIK